MNKVFKHVLITFVVIGVIVIAYNLIFITLKPYKVTRTLNHYMVNKRIFKQETLIEYGVDGDFTSDSLYGKYKIQKDAVKQLLADRPSFNCIETKECDSDSYSVENAMECETAEKTGELLISLCINMLNDEVYWSYFSY